MLGDDMLRLIIRRRPLTNQEQEDLYWEKHPAELGEKLAKENMEKIKKQFKTI